MYWLIFLYYIVFGVYPESWQYFIQSFVVFKKKNLAQNGLRELLPAYTRTNIYILNYFSIDSKYFKQVIFQETFAPIFKSIF